MNIPSSLIAGDSFSLLESWSDYPASAGWVLSYVLVNGNAKIVINSSAEDDGHRLTETSANSTSWAAGDYSAILIAIKGDDRTTLGNRSVTIQPDPIASATLDGRSQSRKTLAALRLAYDAMIATGGLVQTVEVNGRKTTFRTAEDILMQIKFWQRQVVDEELAKNLQNGAGLGGRILTRL